MSSGLPGAAEPVTRVGDLDKGDICVLSGSRALVLVPGGPWGWWGLALRFHSFQSATNPRLCP